jgi:hypothetical protein
MNDIAVISPFLDFDDNPLRIDGFLKFKESLEEQGVPFYVMEIFSEGNSPKIKKFCDNNYFSRAIYFPMWIRENAINVLSSKIPPEYTKLVWMDCDMIIKQDNWAEEVSGLLENHKLVKIAESTSWGGMATRRDFFESVGLFDLDFSGMGDYVSYLSATKENLLKDEEEFLDLYKSTNLEIYFKILSYRAKAFEYFQGDCKILNLDIEKFISNQNVLLPSSIEKKKERSLLLKYINLERNVSYKGLHETIEFKNVRECQYPRLLVNYLRSGMIDENQIYAPPELDLLSAAGEVAPSSEKTKAAIIKELKDLKLAQFEIVQKEIELLKVLENQN